MKGFVAGLIGALLPLPAVAGQEPTKVPPGTPVTITVSPAAPPAPPVSIALNGRQGLVTPSRRGFAHTGGGNIGVAQPSSDTVVITLTGVAVAGGHPKGSLAGMDFDVSQGLEITFDKPEVKAAKLTLEGRVIGLLRSHRKGGGSAQVGDGCVTVSADGVAVASLTVPAQSVGGGQSLSINSHGGPVTVPVGAGKYTLHQSFRVSAVHPKGLFGKAASAEFAPDPALDPLWISYWEPFHGAAKSNFGFQVTIKVAEETVSGNGNGKAKEPEGRE